MCVFCRNTAALAGRFLSVKSIACIDCNRGLLRVGNAERQSSSSIFGAGEMRRSQVLDETASRLRKAGTKAVGGAPLVPLTGKMWYNQQATRCLCCAAVINWRGQAHLVYPEIFRRESSHSVCCVGRNAPLLMQLCVTHAPSAPASVLLC